MGVTVGQLDPPMAFPANHDNDGTACIFEFHRKVSGVDQSAFWRAKYDVDLNGDGARCSLSTKNGPDILQYGSVGGDPCGDICNSPAFVTEAKNMIMTRLDLDNDIGNMTGSEHNNPSRNNGINSCTMYFGLPGQEPKTSFVQYDADTCRVSANQDVMKLDVARVGSYKSSFYAWTGQP
jgi:hypothetical protein